MESLQAFAKGGAARAAGNKQRVFDWDKAARLLRGKTSASAGLSSDLEWTEGEILTDGKPNTDDYTYLSSNWAEPVLVIDGEEMSCWCHHDEWDSDTKWPASALKIFNEEE